MSSFYTDVGATCACSRDNWPRLGLSVALKDIGKNVEFEGVDFCCSEVDARLEGMFPWTSGEAPSPLIAMVADETTRQTRMDAQTGPFQLSTAPVRTVDVLSPMVVADCEFVGRLSVKREIASLYKRRQREES